MNFLNGAVEAVTAKFMGPANSFKVSCRDYGWQGITIPVTPQLCVMDARGLAGEYARAHVTHTIHRENSNATGHHWVTSYHHADVHAERLIQQGILWELGFQRRLDSVSWANSEAADLDDSGDRG